MKSQSPKSRRRIAGHAGLFDPPRPTRPEPPTDVREEALTLLIRLLRESPTPAHANPPDAKENNHD